MIKSQLILYAKSALELGSFKKAAHAHNISEPAFSRNIANLENNLGVKLFSRHATGVTATEYGKALDNFGGKVIAAISELEREISLLRGLGKGQLSVAFGPYPAEISGHTALAHLISEYPNIRCKITVADWREVEELVLRHKADLGVAEISEAVNNKNLLVKPLAKHRFVFYCRSEHPLLQKRNITKDDFKQFPLVLIKLSARLSPIFPGRLFPVENKDHLVPSIEFQDIVLSREIVLKSNAIGAATPYQISKELAEGSLTVIPLFESWMTLNYGFIHMKDRTLSSVVEKYMSIVEEVEERVDLENEILIKQYIPTDKK